MCESVDQDLCVFISKHAETRLKIVAKGSGFIPYNTKSGEEQRTGYIESNGTRVPVYWKFGRWNASPD